MKGALKAQAPPLPPKSFFSSLFFSLFWAVGDGGINPSSEEMEASERRESLGLLLKTMVQNDAVLAWSLIYLFIYF